MNAPLRLSPSMVSRKGLAMQFIRRYLRENGFSPSYGEISSALDIHVSDARRLVSRLKKDGLIEREKGAHRGIRLAVLSDTAEMTRQRAIELLRADGFTVFFGQPLFAADTNTPLQFLDILDHIPDRESGSGDEQGTERG